MGGSKKEAQKAPPINAKDQDEEKFIQYVPHDSSTSHFLDITD